MKTPRRRFTIADGMILVAASAVGFLTLRAYLPGFLELLPSLFRRPGEWAVAWFMGPPTCLVAAWSLALIAIRLRSPRPRRWRLIRQPGLVASIALGASMVPGLIWVLAIWYYRRQGFERIGFASHWYCVIGWADAAVFGAWVVLLLSGRWRAEPGWVDRLGRLLGAYWISLLLLPTAYQGILALINLL